MVNGWNLRHPNINDNFYSKIDPGPQSKEEADLKYICQNHAVTDFDLQLDILNLELEMLEEQTDSIQEPYLDGHLDKIANAKERKIKLLNSKRFHVNVANAYWYYIANINK